MSSKSSLKRYGYLWITLILFLGSVVGHWIFAWYAYREDQKNHNQTPDVNGYIAETVRDTFENWQSEFLQLIWQVAGLSYLWYIGSPQSKEGDDRKEEKIDEILRRVGGRGADKVIASLDKKYPKK